MEIQARDRLDDEGIRREAERQLGRPIETRKIHVSLVRVGDTVFHEGRVRTVSARNLTHDTFMGHRLFGDSHVLGRRPVHRIDMGLVTEHACA